ncbi:SDR family NAD(P)-dependent oxidoreductase [Microbulbifer spongiae]|uniref:SDR family NAD(P)-dependent oxidoreductase n=1 Tax=Microbulbifer spongiae TaxID=2944933 RepID=A0ABY9E9C3_9GAMM|nr:SDR family NAD(P)-dependent oxidoreductase [Microbulbifer sp. MI-G]WKD49045.1 SDR family NAD(P)-dependent oxidoreductase [Microbulbifer sp. MI-G]
MKTAFITGAAEGQGLSLALKLDDLGWKVFAGVLPGLDTSKLTVSGRNIIPVEQDVSTTDSVVQSSETVASKLNGAGLNLLVNNAGIANLAQGVIEGLDIEDLQQLFEVNTYGQLRTVQAFLPMLRAVAPEARILNYASGVVIANTPGAGAYTMSKHAVTGMTLTLRHELAPLGVQATTIMPGGVKTSMTKDIHRTTQEIWNQISDNIRTVYEPHLREATTQILPDMVVNRGNSVEEMTEKVLKIIGTVKLKPIYLVGKDVKPLGIMRRWLSDSTLEKLIRMSYKIDTRY